VLLLDLAADFEHAKLACLLLERSADVGMFLVQYDWFVRQLQQQQVQQAEFEPTVPC
jgi:hypothetical protein